MNKPDNIEIFEHPLATYWLDENGIMHIVTNPVVRTLEKSQSLIQDLKKVIGDKKVYCITDLTTINEIPKESRDFYKKEVPEMFLAVAYITQSEFSRMVAAVFSLIFNPIIPTKIFNNQSEAINWLNDLQAEGEKIIPTGPSGKKVKGKLLYVDDSVEEELIMKFALKNGDWDVEMIFYSDPKKALEFLKKTNDEIFLIISDINMPGMDGFDFKKAIDGDEELTNKSIPFIFFSNSCRKEDIVEAYDNKVQGYFQKPVDFKDASTLLGKIFNYWLVNRHPHRDGQ